MKKLILGGGFILSFFCIAIIFALSISPTNIVKAQASVTPKADARSFPSFGAVKSVQSNIGTPSRTPLSQPMIFSVPNSNSSLVAGRDYIEGDVIVKYKKAKINLETTAGQTQANSFNSTKKVEKREFLKKATFLS